MDLEKRTKPIMSLPPLSTDMDYNINHAKGWRDFKKKNLIYKGEPKEKKHLIYKGERYRLVKC